MRPKSHDNGSSARKWLETSDIDPSLIARKGCPRYSSRVNGPQLVLLVRQRCPVYRRLAYKPAQRRLVVKPALRESSSVQLASDSSMIWRETDLASLSLGAQIGPAYVGNHKTQPAAGTAIWTSRRAINRVFYLDWVACESSMNGCEYVLHLALSRNHYTPISPVPMPIP